MRNDDDDDYYDDDYYDDFDEDEGEVYDDDDDWAVKLGITNRVLCKFYICDGWKSFIMMMLYYL